MRCETRIFSHTAVSAKDQATYSVSVTLDDTLRTVRDMVVFQFASHSSTVLGTEKPVFHKLKTRCWFSPQP